MDARRNGPWKGLATGLLTLIVGLLVETVALGQFGAVREHVAHSQNFIVFAAHPDLAARASEAAERLRKELAIYWLGEELPAWAQRCPIRVIAGPQLQASGETRFAVAQQRAGNWMMIVNGTEQRIMDSVLPHEITHTIFATHFAKYDKYVPRWADEGACTTVEHDDEKSKHRHYLQKCLRTGRGLAFNRMFSLKDYPNDILPLYAQSHSVVQFLLDQGGPQKFIRFLEKGLPTGAWEVAMRDMYEYQTLGEFQKLWNDWLRDGSPADLNAYAPSLRRDSSVVLAAATQSAERSPDQDFSAQATNPQALPSSNTIQLAQNDDPLRGLESASYASGHSWYRQRLRAVGAGSMAAAATGTDSNVANSDSAQLGPATQLALQAYQPPLQTNARPQPSQGVQVQVLDWGNSQPISGMVNSATSGPSTTPWMR